MRLERMRNNITANNTVSSSACENCVQDNEKIVENAINEFVNAVGQAHTAISDTFDSEVNNRPSAQQWTVCTP